MLSGIAKHFKKNKLEISIVILILLIAAFFRLYRISDYMTFLGDEGRDAIVAKEILNGDLTLLGPRASAGDFFLGPIYYYMMAPFLLISNYDPVGPAIMVALFGVSTVFLVYFVGKKLFNKRAGIVAAFLYAVSPLVIAYSRSSWNPNLMPFFSLLILYLLYTALKKQEIKLFIIIGFLLGIAMQLHYLSTFLAVIIFLFVLIGEFILVKRMFVYRSIKNYFFIFLGFLIGLSPFLLFEVRHGFPNTLTIFRFIFSGGDEGTRAINYSFFGNILDVFYRLFARLVTKFPPPEQVNVTENLHLKIWMIATIIISLASLIYLFKIKDKLKILFLSSWLFIGTFLFGFYTKSIYDYYLGFMFPVPFLLVGNLVDQLASIRKNGILWGGVALFIFLGLLTLNLSGNPFRFEPNKQKDQAKNIAEFVLSKTNNKPFNFALLTRGNSDHVYRYFFEVNNRAPVTILNTQVDPDRKSVTDQLMIVCEYAECQPLGNSLWEVAGFGRAEIAGEWYIPFVKIFRLVHYYRPAGFSLSKLTLDTSYEKSELGFSFEYPSALILVENANPIHLKDKPYSSLIISSPEISDETRNQKGFDENKAKSDTIRIFLTIFENRDKISLEEFIKNFDRKEVLDDNYTESSIPKPDSFVFEGSPGDEFVKNYYISNQNYFYLITLKGDKSGYSPTAEKLFDTIVASIEFK